MTEREAQMAVFLRLVAHHSRLRGDGAAELFEGAASCLEAAIGTTGLAIALAPLEGMDRLLAHEIELVAAAEAAGLDQLQTPSGAAVEAVLRSTSPVVQADGSAWMVLRGIDGPLAVLALRRPRAGWRDEAADLAFAQEVVDELRAALLRHWTEQQHSDRALALLEAQRHTHVGCFEWDIVADKVRWSDELFRIFGDEPQSFEPTFEEFLERIHEDDRDAVRASVYKAYEERRDYRIEERIVRPDGSVRQLTSWGHVIVDENTVPVKIVGSCQDVTDFRAAMHELASTERRLAEVQERRAQAMELNDNVVQGLAAALYALELDRTDDARAELTGTLRSARSIIDELLTTSGGDVDEVGLLRTEPAHAFLDRGPIPPRASGSGGSPVRVVIADDSSDIRWLASMILSNEADFHVVAEAENGAEAVTLVATHQPDMVLLDLAMPVLDGLGAIPEILATAPNTLIVAFSGFNAGSAADEAISRGAHAYLEKGHIDVTLPSVLRSIRARTPTDPPLIAGSDA